MPTRRRAMRHQLHAMYRARQQEGRVGFYMAPGTGKTLPAIRYARIHSPCLVVLRGDDILTWLTELALENEASEDIDVIDSKDVEFVGPPNKWTLVTYDVLKDPTVFNWVVANYFGIVIADEVHLLKRHKSQRTKTVIAATRHIEKRIGCTGSPLTNNLEDPFSTSLFIDDGQTFGNNYWRYRKRHFIQAGPGWYPKRTAKRSIERGLAKLSYVVHEDDVMDLPPKRFVLKAVPMTGVQRRVYERAVDEWEYEIDGEIIEMDYVVARLQKLRQIASGFMYDPDGNAHWMRSHKLNLLQELMSSEDYLGDEPKIVVWAAHSAEIERIAEVCEDIGRKAVLFYGKRKKLKNAARTSFLTDRRTSVFIGQADSGVGINELRVARHGIYYNNSYRVVSRQQSERRIRRRGSEHHDAITYWDLVTRGTVDENIYRSVRELMDVAEGILARIRAGQSIRRVLSDGLIRAA